MKILVLSLLRIGDCLMMAPVIKGLKSSRKNAQVDVLSFRQSAQLHAMLPEVSNWWVLDREQLQAGLGQADIPLLTSFSVLQEKLDFLSTQKYDLVINLTHTSFSGWISGYIRAADRIGLNFDSKGIGHFYSPWFRYLNSLSEDSDQGFHFSDIFKFASGLRSPLDYSLVTTTAALEEVNNLKLDRSQNTCVIQLFTSDEKKNWPLTSWRKLLKTLPKSYSIVALGAPNEQERIDHFIDELQTEGVAIKKAILSMPGALALLKRSQLLLTGDTSIKHLANAADIKVVELSLGWSDWRKTGIFKRDSLILKGPQTFIDADLAAEYVNAFVQNNWGMVRAIASRQNDLVALRTRHLEAGFWFAENMSDLDSTQFKRLLELVARKLMLNGEDRKALPEIGSVSLLLRQDIASIFGSTGLKNLNFIESFNRQQINAPQPLGLDHSDITDIAQYRKNQIALDERRSQAEFEIKLIRSLKSNWTENV